LAQASWPNSIRGATSIVLLPFPGAFETALAWQPAGQFYTPVKQEVPPPLQAAFWL